MKVSTRLFLAIVPAILGLAAVVGLAYWGRYERRAPEFVVVVAVIAAIGSLIMAWRSTRYVARRVQRIAAHVDEGRGGRDELDAIERSVDGLAVARREIREGDAEREAATQRAADLAARLDETIGALSDGVQAVQLPLHILLDSPFGALNENQEEMLEAARAAAEQLEVRLRQSRKLIDVDRGAVAVHVWPIGLAELLRPALAIAEARAAKRGVTLQSSVSPLTPRALVDPMHAQEAVTLALGEALDRAESGSTLHLEAEQDGETRIRIRITGGPAPATTLPLRLAGALLRAQKGELVSDRTALSIDLPSERTERTNP